MGTSGQAVASGDRVAQKALWRACSQLCMGVGWVLAGLGGLDGSMVR